MKSLSSKLVVVILLCGASWFLFTAANENLDRAMFGGTPDRNMVSDAKGISSDFDPDTGKNILWKAALGSQTYAGPVIFNGQVFVGTNNGSVRNPKLTGDRGNVMAFRAADGEFLWQAAHAKLAVGRVNDWPLQGVCSTPYLEGDRLYYLSNRGELICADTQGFRDGENDGPFDQEAEKSEIDLDVVWKLDMINELDVFPHNLAASSPLIVGDLLYTVTSNGVDEDHLTLPSPRAPSFIAVDKDRGELVWESDLPGKNILHGQWSNPTYGTIHGREQVIFAGGDGWLYGLEPKTGEMIWKFDCNPKDSVWLLGGAGTRNNIIATPVIWDNKVYLGVGQDPEHGEAPGHFWVIEPRGEGDLTDKALVWHRGGDDFNRTISTVAIKDGILYAADLSGYLYCLDAKTGELHWTYNAYAAVWGSPLVVDGKVFIGDEDGDLAILKEGTEMELLGEPNFGSAILTTPVAKDGVLYVASRNTLFAIKQQ